MMNVKLHKMSSFATPTAMRDKMISLTERKWKNTSAEEALKWTSKISRYFEHPVLVVYDLSHAAAEGAYVTDRSNVLFSQYSRIHFIILHSFVASLGCLTLQLNKLTPK